MEPPRPRELREREVELRERVLLLPLLLRDLAAPADDFFAVDALRVPPVRDAPGDDDFARLDAALLPLLFARDEVEREPDDFARDDDLRALPDFLAPLLRDEDDDEEPELVLAVAEPSIVHLPDMTRCAASATASAISDPSLVALCMTLLAACDAVSAASRPASRIALRAFGLALIAAAAAARPAASISLLIAALASLSVVLALLVLLPAPLVRREEEVEELLRADLAMCVSLRSRKDTSRL